MQADQHLASVASLTDRALKLGDTPGGMTRRAAHQFRKAPIIDRLSGQDERLVDSALDLRPRRRRRLNGSDLPFDRPGLAPRLGVCHPAVAEIGDDESASKVGMHSDIRAQAVVWIADGYWLGRQDLNLGMAESKSAIQAEGSTCVPTLPALYRVCRIKPVRRKWEHGRSGAGTTQTNLQR